MSNNEFDLYEEARKSANINQEPFVISGSRPTKPDNITSLNVFSKLATKPLLFHMVFPKDWKGYKQTQKKLNKLNR